MEVAQDALSVRRVPFCVSSFTPKSTVSSLVRLTRPSLMQRTELEDDV